MNTTLFSYFFIDIGSIFHFKKTFFFSIKRTFFVVFISSVAPSKLNIDHLTTSNSFHIYFLSCCPLVQYGGPLKEHPEYRNFIFVPGSISSTTILGWIEPRWLSQLSMASIIIRGSTGQFTNMDITSVVYSNGECYTRKPNCHRPRRRRENMRASPTSK